MTQKIYGHRTKMKSCTSYIEDETCFTHKQEYEKPNRLSKQSVTDTKTWNCIEHERNEEIKERIKTVTKKTVYSSKVEHTYNNFWAMQLAVSST